MNFLTVYLRIYGDCLRKALVAIGRNPWTLLLPITLFLALEFAGLIIASLNLGFVGGMVLGAVLIALFSSYLHFVSGLVLTGKVHLSELKGSFGRLFWPVMGVSFVVWIASMVVGLFARGSEQAGGIGKLFEFAVVLLCFINPTPEVIYDRGSQSGMATLQKSFSFTQENWIEWYLPNAALAGLGYLALSQMPVLGMGGLVGLGLVAGAILHLVMIFRGHLYRALDGTSHRQRMFKFRNQ